jgi:hypothetical protein
MRSVCVAALCALLPSLALASVGKVVALEGQAWRTADGVKTALAVGTAVEAHDELSVGEPGKLKLLLGDGSEVALGPGSILNLDQAVFQGGERSFFGNLRVGRMLTWVKKKLTGSKQKFEVGTDRAVAGVRGTIFSVEVTPEIVHAYPPKNKTTRVKVTKGRVAVQAGAKAKKKERHQVAGPQQISKQEWEKRFVLLKRNQMVEIGDGGWKQSSFDPAAPDDLKTFLDATP